MAARTIAAGGGNFSSTATWVGGIIPTSSDHIIGDATSGQLTLDGNYQVQYVNFTNYTQTLTLNATRTLTLSLASSTNTFDSGMSFAGTGTITFGSVASTIVQNTTSRIPNVIFNGSVTRTLSTNVYVGNFTHGNIPSFNGNTIYISGSCINSSGTATVGIGGTTSFVLDGSGMVNCSFRVPLTITGNYNTFGAGVFLNSSSLFTYTTGATPTLFNVLLNKNISSNDTYNLNVTQPINLFYTSTACNSLFGNMTINLSSPFMPLLIAPRIITREFTTDNIIPTITFSGNSVSATTMNIGATLRTTSSSTNPPPSGSLTHQANTIRLDHNYTHYFGSLQLAGGTTTNSVISSIVGGNQVPINLGSKITSQIINYNFTDVNASGGEQIIAINGTLSNTTNITNVYPTGSGGGETAYTFAS